GVDGRFSLTKPKDGSYRIQVNFIGYETRKMPVLVSAAKPNDPLEVLMPLYITSLDDIEITAPEPMVQVMGDTTQFSASEFTTEPYADADELITQLPGVEMDAEGNILAQGEQVQRILVDGKEFFSSDPRIALKTLPADVI